MDLRTSLIERILNIQPDQFDDLAVEIAQFQYRNNLLYRQYCDLLSKVPDQAGSVADIAFLPIQFFKQTLITSNARKPEIVFASSTTTGNRPSHHGLWEPGLYTAVAENGYAHVMGHPVSEVAWLALLPSYLERPDASLVSMMREFIAIGGEGSGFFLDDLEGLANTLQLLESQQRPTVLLGVSFALMEFSERYPMKLNHTRIIETGGMKGRRVEITREELHDKLIEAFGLSQIGSEYGMTELLSQAWSTGDGLFHCTPTLRVLTREIHDPLHLTQGRRGAINCIDLANIDSCSFIATDDAGLVNDDGSFYMLGRLDGTEQRGCNLMVNDL